MKITKMYLDGDLNTKPEGSTLQNKNVLIRRTPGIWKGEPGTLLLEETGREPVGSVQLPDNTKLLFLAPDTLAIVDGQSYRILKVGNFNFTKSIMGAAAYNNKHEIVVVWVDGSAPKYLNLSHIPDTITDSNISLNVYDFKPVVTTTLVSGQLPAGSVFPIIRGITEEGSTTGWIVYPPVKVFDVANLSIDQVEGNRVGSTTAVGIKIDITGPYTQYEYGYIQVLNGERFYYSVGKAGSTYTITGSESRKTITDEEVLLSRAFYKNVGLVANLHNILYLGDLEYFSDTDIQIQVNGIGVKWTDTLVQMNSLKTNTQVPGFQAGEVVALYYRAKFPYGFTSWFPLAGRSRVAGDGSSNAFRTNDTCNLDGTLSYWENEDEFYPDEARYGILRNQKVRHHKLPTLNWLKTNKYSGDNTVGTFRLPRLDFVLSNLPVIDGAIGWELGYAKRTPENSLVLGQTPVINSVIDAGAGDTLPNKIYSVGANLIIPTGILGFPTLAPENTFFRLYPFDLLLGATAIPKNFRREYKLTSSNTSIFTKIRRQPASPTQEEFDKLNVRFFSTIDYTDGTVATVANTENTGPIEYLPKDVYYKRISNFMLESAYIIKYDTVSNELDIATPTVSVGNSYNEQTYLITLLTGSTNVYKSFDKQQVIVAGSANNNFIGDTYITEYTFHTYGKKRANDENYQLYDAGLIFARRLVVYSHYPIALRTTIPGAKPYTDYYPKQILANYSDAWTVDVEPNGLINGFNKDYSVQYDTTVTKFFDSKAIYAYPNAITRSAIYQSIDNWFGWRDFRLADILFMPSDKGRMTNLVGLDDMMYIHFEHNLYITRGGEEIQIIGKKATYIGTGDVFTSAPEEILHDVHGALGLQHRCASILTSYGYIFAETLSDIGAIFLISGKEVKVLSDNGMIAFFRDNMNVISTRLGINLQLGYDPKFKRLLVMYNGKLPKNMPSYRGQYISGMKLQAGDIVYKDNTFVRVQSLKAPVQVTTLAP